eukprot:10536727-Alexandrium_andersonii.AAC.1
MAKACGVFGVDPAAHARLDTPAPAVAPPLGVGGPSPPTALAFTDRRPGASRYPGALRPGAKAPEQ